MILLIFEKFVFNAFNIPLLRVAFYLKLLRRMHWKYMVLNKIFRERKSFNILNNNIDELWFLVETYIIITNECKLFHEYSEWILHSCFFCVNRRISFIMILLLAKLLSHRVKTYSDYSFHYKVHFVHFILFI